LTVTVPADDKRRTTLDNRRDDVEILTIVLVSVLPSPERVNDIPTERPVTSLTLSDVAPAVTFVAVDVTVGTGSNFVKASTSIMRPFSACNGLLFIGFGNMALKAVLTHAGMGAGLDITNHSTVSEHGGVVKEPL
jgi:hypothetical protein